MATLITGGSSQIGIILAKLLQAAGRKPLFATHTPHTIPEGYDHVIFDRMDPSTFSNAFRSGWRIGSVYLLPPIGVVDPLKLMKSFIDLALKNGVKTFVLVSSSTIEKGDDTAGRLHAYFDGLPGVRCLVLRPTTFIETIFGIHSRTIREGGEIISAVPRGAIPFVAVEDVAQVAFDFLIDSDSTPLECSEVFIVGPQWHTYDGIASLLTYHVGRPIVHRAITPEEQVARYIGFRVPEDYARWLVRQEVKTNEGEEARLLDVGRKYIGKRTLEEVLESKREFWSL